MGNRYEKGSAILFGSFAGQQNYEHPVATHPLEPILTQWAGVAHPNLRSPSLVELREMQSQNGRFVFFFNHWDKPASVEFSRELDKPAAGIREIMTDQKITATGKTFSVKLEIPPQSVRIYRIDY